MRDARDPYVEWLKTALEKDGKTQTGLALHLGLGPSAINKVVRGRRGLKSAEIARAAEYLEEPAPQPMVSIVGVVGANPDGTVLYAEGQQTGDLVPVPPGGSGESVAVEVVGHSMRGVADDGSLVYYEDRHDPPTEDMLGHPVVVGLDTGEVLIKRLLRGSEPGLYDLESSAAPLRSDARVLWAAHITAIIPPHQAKKIIFRG